MTFENLQRAVAVYLAEFLELSPDEQLDASMVELVAGRCADAQEALSGGSVGHYYSRLESSSTYVLVDMSEERLAEYVEMMEDAIALAASFDEEEGC